MLLWNETGNFLYYYQIKVSMWSLISVHKALVWQLFICGRHFIFTSCVRLETKLQNVDTREGKVAEIQ